MAQDMHFSKFKVGDTIKLGDITLVKTDLPDKMKVFTSPELKLMMVSKDAEGNNLVAIDGDYSRGVVQVNAADNSAVGYWSPQSEWEELRPGTCIKMGEVDLVRHDDPETIRALATESKMLQVVTPDWHGYQLMAQDGDVAKGLLMVNSDANAVGFWMPKAEYDAKFPNKSS
jgi:hypothetical protein|uniref:Uncharacterized protein n=1 Tax=Eutreptiella gymnastica TaxID=73025 RepID=A0A6T2M2N9_9EUGL